jgi:two-component system, cell cycle sensor histidine kinase and response regulator CckA
LSAGLGFANQNSIWSSNLNINPCRRGEKTEAAIEHECIRILHLEDSTEDAWLIQHMMKCDGLKCDVVHVTDQARFEVVLEQQPFDIVLCDHGIPGYNGFAALNHSKRKCPETPVIMVSGSMDEGEAVKSLKGGATDYILKDRLHRLVPAVRRALVEAAERRKQAEADERIRRQASLLDLTRDAIVVRNMEDQIVFWNRGAELLFGWNRDEAMGQHFGQWLGGEEAALGAAKSRLLGTDDWQGELKLRSRTGNEKIVFSRWNLLRDKRGRPDAILSANTDVTEQRTWEAVYLRAQRMDSIGALAGGIAHDLNNCLAPVMMSAELLIQCKNDTDRARLLELIMSSIQRATGMVKQILSFARGSSGQSAPVPLQRSVLDIVRMMRETFPKSIEINIRPAGKELWKVQGSATELHQVLLNLCVNARDAMPQGGRLFVSVENVTLPASDTTAFQAAPGTYVRLSVADTGTGIPPEVLPHIFEPFFTTKPADQGTGLGLSTVASIVHQHGGFIDIKTEARKGTEFRVYLPASEYLEGTETRAKALVQPVGHKELVLVIDDEEAVCELVKMTLESYGYRAITAKNGVQGVALFKEYKEEVRLVVSDTDMPLMGGLAMISAMKSLKPDLPVILASGSRQDTDLQRRNASKDATNLTKPYTLEQLLVAVDTVLKR